jgi:Mg-chelatase subunit ChlD
MILAAALAMSLSGPPAPACQRCPEGVAIIFAVINTPQAEWQRAELSGALDLVVAMAPGRWRGAVVAYDDGGARLVAPLGSSEATIRAALNSPRSSWSWRGRARDAARLVEVEAGLAGAVPCKVTVFAAYTKSHYAVMREELLGAAALLTGRVIITCPVDPGNWSCRDPEPEMARSRRLFVVYPAAGRVAGEVYEQLSDIQRGSPVVECSTLTPTPTTQPTPRPPSATATRAASATPTPTRTASPAPRPVAIYIPFADRLECHPGRDTADVVLVLDMSTSMRRLTSAGRSKMLAALDAAREFVGLLGPGDRAAVAGFNDIAWPAIGLTGDHEVLARALDSLPARTAEGTRLDLALIEGGLLAAGARARPVVILLTDGLPNRVPVGPRGTQEETVLAAASAVKGEGARVFTIALGTTGDIDQGLMRAVASGSQDAYTAADGEALAGIYRAIASRISGRCP